MTVFVVSYEVRIYGKKLEQVVHDLDHETIPDAVEHGKRIIKGLLPRAEISARRVEVCRKALKRAMEERCEREGSTEASRRRKTGGTSAKSSTSHPKGSTGS